MNVYSFTWYSELLQLEARKIYMLSTRDFKKSAVKVLTNHYLAGIVNIVVKEITHRQNKMLNRYSNFL